MEKEFIIRHKYRKLILEMWHAFKTRQYLYGYINCLLNSNIIHDFTYDVLMNDVFCFRR